MKKSKLFLILLTILFETGCADIDIPPPPNVFLCDMNFDKKLAFCSKTMTQEASTMPITEMDIAMRASDWNTIIKYVNDLKTQLKSK